MPSRPTSLLVGLLAATALSSLLGCASATLDVVSPVPVALDRVSLTVIDDTGGDMSPDQLRAFKRTVTHALLAAGIDVLPSPKPGAARVIGSVERWDPGIRALRFVSRYGFGTGGLESVWDVRGTRSDTLARCRIEGSVSTGTFGGSFDDVQEETGEALARFLRGGIR